MEACFCRGIKEIKKWQKQTELWDMDSELLDMNLYFVFFLWWKQASIVHRGQTQVEHGLFEALYQLNHLLC